MYVHRFNSESYCVVFTLANSDVVQVTSNVADEVVAKMIADSIRKQGGHIFATVKAGVLIAAMQLVKEGSK